VDFPVFSDSYKVATFNKYISKDVRRHISSTISDRCVIGQQTEIGANTLIVNSVIGDHCKIHDNVTIRNCIIWSGVTIKSGCNLEHNLICSNVTIGEEVTLKPGVMLDHRVIVKSKAILDQNTIGSCLAIMTNDKGQASFKEVSEPNPKYFDRGVVCFLPIGMELKKYQFIGQAAPVSDSESDIEQSDDDSQQVEMTNRKFKEMIKEQMQQIFAKENSIDVALLNMRSWKHGHDGDHTVYLSAIIPSVLNEVVAKTTSKTSKKAGFDMLKAEMLTYKEIIRSFA
jgi:carbonic anhydrase/acetyltransferase-like protein (isoleucine patch superfamily)